MKRILFFPRRYSARPVRLALGLMAVAGLLLGLPFSSTAQQQGGGEGDVSEDDYYRMQTLPLPQGMKLEVGGLALTPAGQMGVVTRRGDLWLVENPDMQDRARPFYRRFAQGLHEPLGLAYHDGAFYAAQRGELTRLEDTDGDSRADQYDAVTTWPLSGNYHEYSYGPEVLPDGRMILTFNLGWQGEGVSLVPWSGWMMEVTPEGELRPFAAGLRSPAGIGLTPEGEIFYAENQGDWVGSGRISHVEKGDFLGHPASLRWTGKPGVPKELRGVEPSDVPSTGTPMHEVAEDVPALKMPAAWFPHAIMGISTSDILTDTTEGTFGPFEGQYFVGDQGHSRVMRMDLEQVEGEYQAAVFPFRENFASGIVRLAWGPGGGLFAGMTSRGWNAKGERQYGLQRLTWTGRTPFEMETVHARPDGFKISFTRPVDPAVAGDPSVYQVSSFSYKYHQQYGSDIIRRKEHAVQGVKVDEDGRSVRLAVESPRKGYIHEVALDDTLQSESGTPLLHNTAYYTLKNIPGGERLALSELPDAHRAEGVLASAAAGGSSAGESAPASSPSTGEDTAASEDASSDGSASGSSASGDSASQAPAGDLPKHQTTLPESWTGGPDKTVSIAAAPGLEYDLREFEVKAGSRVKLVLTNPTDLQHNLVIVAPGTWSEVAQKAINLGLEGPEMDYVPETDNVRHYTSLLDPGGSETIYFRAPTETGDHTYVCTFPGHAQSMRGTMIVTPR